MAITETKTKYGQVHGVQKDGYTVFRGVPYAKPPVGEKRFCPPEEPECWEGVYEADHFGCVCPQTEHEPDSFYGKEFYLDPEFGMKQSEDCLYLNIWTPANTVDEKLPVAFWIHGGAFMHGFSHESEFDGAAYCERGVILVTINYRLGAFGFLAHPWLSEESGVGRSGNYAILDQIAALKWVKENIAAFGGDPENITVFGQSAGCMSVQTLISSPLTENWISKAIFQSAGGYDTGLNRDMPLSEAETIGQEFVELSGAKSLEELRAIPAEKIVELQEEFGRVNPSRMLSFVPNIDDYLLTCGYNEAVTERKIKDIPYMLGSTADDIGVFPEMKEKGEHGGIYKGCINWSLALEKLGRKPAYVYYFTRALLGDDAGAFHSSELWYMFGTLGRSWRPKTEGDYALSKEMMDDWTNFMKTGNPNAEGKDDWKPCTKDDPYVQVLDVRE